MIAKTTDKLTGARRRSGGFALLMVLMLIATASVVGISYIYGAQVKTAGTINLIFASEARYLAESGLQHGLYSLQTRATPFGSEGAPNGPYNVMPGDGGYVFYIASTSTPNEYRIVATGTEDGISQTVSMTVRLTSEYAQKMIDLNPRYWWRLGDSGFTAVDEQGRNNGTYVNAVIRGVEGAILGDSNTAAKFRGSNDYIDISGVEDMDYNHITLGCWVRADAWHSIPRLMSRASGTSLSDRRWELAVSGTRKLRFSLRLGDDRRVVFGNTELQLGQWYFVVATYNKGLQQMKVYLNGELDGTKSGTPENAQINDDDSLDAWIGDGPSPAGERAWEGPIDEVFILKNVALAPEQIKELYDASIPNIEVISWDD